MRRLILFLLTALLALPAAAQEWPTRPIRLIIPFAAGGGTDVVARVAVSCMSLGQPIVVDNRAGAGGTIGTDLAAKAAPDGYTLVSLTLSTAVLNTFLYQNLTFDTRRDLAAVAEIGRSPNIVAVRRDFPARDIAGLIAHARANPERVTYGSGGSGTIVHLSTVLFANMAGVTMQHVPFRSGTQGLQAVMAGQVDLIIDSLPVLQGAARDNSVRAIAVTSAARLPEFPNLPTVIESGLPGFETQNWFGIFAPARTPRAIVDRVANEVTRVTRDPACRQKLVDIGVGPTGLGPEALTAFWDSELAAWGPIVRSSGARVE
jgi:tripartite-type tricarboxylate transporter receptor subunit TctC